MSNQQNILMLGEKELIKGCAEGNRVFQKSLYDRYCRKMMAVCLRYARSTEEAEDILQEGFIKIFNSIGSFRSEAKLETWITRIIINTALNSHRQKLYMLPMVDVNDLQISEEDSLNLADFHLSDLITMVQSLPDGCRIVFNLFAIEGYGHKEIAEMLAISEGTSKSQYNRAKSLLRAKLIHEEGRYERFK